MKTKQKLIVIGSAIRSKVKRSRGYDSLAARKERGEGNSTTDDYWRERSSIEVDSLISKQSRNQILRSDWLHRLENRRDSGIQEIWRERTVISCSIRTRSIRYKSSLDEDLLRDIRSILFVPIRPRTWDHSIRSPSLLPPFPSSSHFCRQRKRRRNFPLALSRFTCPPRTFSSSAHRPRSLTLSTSHGKSQIRVCLPGTWSPGGYRW